MRTHLTMGDRRFIQNIPPPATKHPRAPGMSRTKKHEVAERSLPVEVFMSSELCRGFNDPLDYVLDSPSVYGRWQYAEAIIRARGN